MQKGGLGVALGAGPGLSVVELWRAGTILLLLLVVLQALQSLPGEVLKHNVVVAGGKDKEDGEVFAGQGEQASLEGSEGQHADGTDTEWVG